MIPICSCLFLRAGVFHRYAEGFLRPEQIDAVRIEDYLTADLTGRSAAVHTNPTASG